MLGDIGPKADALLAELKGRAVELKETITRVNDVLNQENRANLQASLGQVRGMLEENRPKVRKTLTLATSDPQSVSSFEEVEELTNPKPRAGKDLQLPDAGFAPTGRASCRSRRSSPGRRSCNPRWWRADGVRPAQSD